MTATAAAKNRIKSRFFKTNPFRPAGDEEDAGNHIFIYFAGAGNHSCLRNWKNFLPESAFARFRVCVI